MFPLTPLWAGDDVDVGVVTEHCQIAGIAEFWQQNSDHPGASVGAFMSELQEAEWVLGPRVLVASRRGTIQGLYIGRLERKCLDYRVGHISVARPRGTVLAYLDRGLVGHVDPQVARAFVESIMVLLRRGDADFAHLASVPDDAHLRHHATSLPSRWCRDTAGILEERWALDVPETFKEFLATRSAGTRSNIKRHERNLRERIPGIRIVTHHRDERSCTLFDDILTVARRSYQFRLGVSPMNAPTARSRWESFCRDQSMSVVVIYDGAEPVAFSYAEMCGSTAYYATPGYDPAYRSHHVGMCSLLALVRLLVEDGAISVLDYGLGYSEYKKLLGTSCAREGHVRIFAPSFRGLYLNTIRRTTSQASIGLSWAAAKTGMKPLLKRMSRAR